ncbi:MAG: hypothetical protein WC222_03785 [Parachlamydiales bacterium]|jgi:hypothetical protein
MESVTTDSILDYFEKHRPIQLPSTADIYAPNYTIYGLIPCWKVSQAVCLLAGIATIDAETYYTLKSFDWLQEKIRVSLETRSHGQGADHYQTFSNYVAFEFPIKSRTITLLKNISRLLAESIKKKEIVCRRVNTNTSFDDLLVPDDVIAWAEMKKIFVPEQLSKGMLQRKAINFLALPEIFPDEICFNAIYNGVRIERNRLKPRFLPSSREEISSCPPVNPPSQKPIIASEKVMCEPAPADIYSKLSEEEKNLSLTNLLYHIGNEARSRLLDKEGIKQLLKALQEKAPCAPVVFKRTTWSLDEAVLIYYNIDPAIFHEVIQSSTAFFLCRHVVLLLDKEDRIFENFQNYIYAKTNGRLPQEVSINLFLQFLYEKKYSVPNHFYGHFESLAKDNATVSVSAKEPSQPSHSQKLLTTITDQRRLFIEICLSDLFEDPHERAPYLKLIDQLGIPNMDEFKSIKTARVPPKKIQEHRCRAIGALLRHFYPDMKIHELEQHHLIDKCKMSKNSLPTSKTFAVWMNREQIFDRPPKKDVVA